MKFEQMKERIAEAGVIGAGGAGFPTHMKLARGIDTVLINASECEPLLYTDFTILREALAEVLAGGQALCEALDAKQVILAMKTHTAQELGFSHGESLNSVTHVSVLPDVYPIGDEILLIHQACGRLVLPGQLPSSVGVVVINAETAYNICNATLGVPVTKKWVMVGGAVPEPFVVRAPINCSIAEFFKQNGVTVPKGHVVIDGGPMMGVVVNPATGVITKKTKALVILPEELQVVTVKSAQPERLLKRTSSACCQCFVCTDMCPRGLIGYPLQPHKTLRAAAAGSIENPGDLLTASLCSGCGLCTMMACTQGITPSVTMTEIKKNLGRHRLGYKSDKPIAVHPDRDYRMVPVSRLLSRIGVSRYNQQARLRGDIDVMQDTYGLLLRQHAGKPSVPVVKQGDAVQAGQMVAKEDEGISAALHTPVSGTVQAVTEQKIIIRTGGGR